MNVTFTESEPRNVDSDLLCRPDHIIQEDIPSFISAITLDDKSSDDDERFTDSDFTQHKL